MITDLKYEKNKVTWIHSKKYYEIEIENVFFASLNKASSLIEIDAGKNFIKSKVYYVTLDGTIASNYDVETGIINWTNRNKKHSFEVNELIQVGYFPTKNLLLIMYNLKLRNIVVLDLDGDYLCEVEKPHGYEMMYIQEFPEHISIVCDGDKDNTDKFGRNRINFRLDENTGHLTKETIAY